MANKFNAQKIELDGIKFDSRKEGKRYQELKLLERAGRIKDVTLQVRYTLIDKNDKFRAMTYLADFQYFDLHTGKIRIEDVKGYRRGAAYQVFKIKQKLMYDKFKIEVIEI